MERNHIFFSGDVQGVGFRFRAQMIASELGLSGWCRNLYDGRVECEVQGDRETINAFIARISHERFINITGIDRMPRDVVLNEKGFKITY